MFSLLNLESGTVFVRGEKMKKEVQYSPAQKAVIEEKARFVQVVAAAGSGKTSTMVGIIEQTLVENLFPEESILVLTFSRKAAEEISDRIQKSTKKNSIRVQTFHAYCLYVIGRWHPRFMVQKPKILPLEDKVQFYREFLKRERNEIGGILYELFWAENVTYIRENFAELKKNLEFAYQKYKKENGFLDFDDLVGIFLDGLRNEEEWTHESRNILRKIIVDEFQDTDLEQLEFLQLLSRNASIVVVGDDSQAIYGFRGTAPGAFLSFQKLFQPCKLHFLNTNYRSLPEIIQTSSIPIQKNREKIEKEVCPSRQGKACVGKILMEEVVDLIPFLIRAIPSSETDLKILCRSNFRISEYVRVGIPKDYLMTIHSSKGLEFHTVFVDVADGWNVRPDSSLETIEEERRILYVGLSRARDRLLILGAAKNSRRETIENEFFRYFKGLKKMEPEDLSK
ncbi:AAA protein [Leptospira borgpetersenii str. Brem 307]|uniref:DNA 3'-5' helicase n=2 Tax=Leptospira borgpetersenii TaxID=174 RepID=A0ABC9SN97_LEPBO|nr:AAA protein [Leptospira borgpetersenii str. Brem 307]EMN19196.1 AAA protein [Leptospira borgpetersenii str. Brem 328]